MHATNTNNTKIPQNYKHFSKFQRKAKLEEHKEGETRLTVIKANARPVLWEKITKENQHIHLAIIAAYTEMTTSV